MIPTRSFPGSRWLVGPSFRATVMVAAGGVAGAGVRWGVASTVGAHTFDWATLIVNVAGSLILGWVGTALLRGEGPRHNLFVAIGSGFCGALTTFSGLTVGVAEHLSEGRWSNGLLTVASTVALSIPAVLAGRAVFLRSHQQQSRLL